MVLRQTSWCLRALTRTRAPRLRPSWAESDDTFCHPGLQLPAMQQPKPAITPRWIIPTSAVSVTPLFTAPESGSDSSWRLSFSLAASRHLHQRPAWPWGPHQGQPCTPCGPRSPPAPAQHGPHKVRGSEQRCCFIEPSAGHTGNCATLRRRTTF